VQHIVPVFMAQALVNITCSLCLTWYLGLPGPVLGTFLSFVMITLWWLPRLLQQHFHIPCSALMKALGFPLVLGIPYACGWAWMIQNHIPRSWLALSAEMGTAAALYLVLAWRTVFSNREKYLWAARVRAYLERRVAP
jgi:peptidoglycan biosynthesis protein MviN/MurJ (putative lipid II flippase)